MSSILDMVRDAVTPELVSRMSGIVGESPAATQKAFGAAVPAILAGTAERAATPDGAEWLLGMITGGDYSGSTLDGPGSLLGGRGASDLMQGGSRILSGLFGGRADRLAGALASFAGLRRGSASSLLSLAAPVVMGVLGKQVASRGLDSTGLASLLGGQRSAFTSAIPSGLTSLLGAGEAADPTLMTPSAERSTTALGRDRFADAEPVERERRGLGAWPLVLAGLAVLALVFLFTRGRAPEVAQAPTPPPAPAASIRESASVALPGGRTLSVNRGGFLDQLGTFLGDTGGTAPPKRFVFDDLNFEPGSTTLTTQSRATVDALGAILTSYPSAQVALEGHTDATGDPTSNRKLSADRAETIKRLLAQAGVAPDRVSVVGHGPERPVASNDTEDGRARNRRTELIVLKR
jgi:OOP family OmpA-OmpF porin